MDERTDPHPAGHEHGPHVHDGGGGDSGHGHVEDGRSGHSGDGHAADGHAGHSGDGHSGHRHGHSADGHAGHGHDHAGHGHSDHDHGRSGWWSRLTHAVRPHSHDHADSIDDVLLVSKEGTRALAVSLAGLLVTAIIQVVVFAASSSVGLLADTIHNFADALTALPLGLAFVVARRPATAQYTYGFGRAEDLAGSSVILVMAVSAVLSAYEAIDRLVHHQRVDHLALVAVAGVVGFLGNELAAQYRIRVGRRIGSAALVADGNHARTDGFTSLAVVLGAVGVAAGWRDADPVVGLAITVAILAVLRGSARDIYRRLMDAVDPALVEEAATVARGVQLVESVDAVRIRWSGHELWAEVAISVDAELSVRAAHDVAEEVSHRLLHDLRRLADVSVHVNPSADGGPDPHAATAHHRRRG